MSCHPDPRPVLPLDSLLWRELKVFPGMRPGPWDHYAPSSLASSTHSPILIISTLSPLLRTSGALSELLFPTATVPTGAVVVQHHTCFPTKEGACDMWPNLKSPQGSRGLLDRVPCSSWEIKAIHRLASTLCLWMQSYAYLYNTTLYPLLDLFLSLSSEALLPIHRSLQKVC